MKNINILEIGPYPPPNTGWSVRIKHVRDAFVLNSCNCQVLRLGKARTVENPEYVPVIRYAMPVFSDNGDRKGAVVFNVYADYFLEDIRRLNKEGDTSFLIDNRGYYLAHSNKSKEFSFSGSTPFKANLRRHRFAKCAAYLW